MAFIREQQPPLVQPLWRTVWTFPTDGSPALWASCTTPCVWVNPTAAVFPEPTDGLMKTKRALSGGGRVLKGWRGCKRGWWGKKKKVTHAFFQMGSLDSYMLKHTFTWVHTCAHTSTLGSRGISGNVGARKWFLQKREGRDICTCTKTAQWSSWFCALNKSGDHGSTSDQILFSPWRPKITHAYQTDWAGQTLGTVSVPEATTHIVSEFL